MYLGGFENKKDIFDNFCISEEEEKDINIVLAYYSNEGYEGSAYVLFKKNNKYYEVSGGHCSCHGLEDQWQPGEVNKEYLLNRVEKGKFTYDKDIDKQMKEAVLKSVMDEVIEEEILRH